MTEEYRPITKISKHNGVFGGYEILGHQYEYNLGDLGWHITAWPQRCNPISNFWVHDKDFYAIKIQPAAGPQDENLFQILGKFDESAIPLDEKQAILQAIEAWTEQWKKCIEEAEQKTS